MKKKFLYLPIEIKVRELDAKLLLALEAITRGYVVLIGSKEMIGKLKHLPSGILLYKDASSPMRERFIDVKSANHKIVVHDEEGFVWADWEQYLNLRIKFESIRYVDAFFCWGAQQYQSIRAVADQYAPHTEFSVVGHPRIDLLRLPLRNYNIPEKKSKKRILINTKLAEYNHNKGQTAFIDIMISHDMIKNDDDLSRYKGQVNYKKKLMDYYINLVEMLSKTYPDIEILVRPHPSENVEKWKALTHNLKNVVVTNEKPIGYWIHRSDVVIHTGCTTAIEALLMDKPIISYKPITDERFENKLPDSISLCVESEKECIDTINMVFNEKIDVDAQKLRGISILKNNIDSLDGEFSYTKILNEIDKLNVPKHSFNFLAKHRLRFIFAKGYICSFLPKKNVNENRIFRKNEIVHALFRLKKSLGIKKNICVDKVGSNLFLLS